MNNKDMTKIKPQLLLVFGLLALSLTVVACVPRVTNTNQAQNNQAIVEDDNNDDSIVEDDDVMMEDDAIEKDDSIMEDNSVQEDDAMMEDTKIFNITGRNFAFSQTEIRVKKGDKVKINFSSVDGFHDWTINEFNAQTTQVNAGGSASVEFVANQAGTFEFYCSVGRHREMGMVGKLIVE